MNQKGFTLIEVITVVAISAILVLIGTLTLGTSSGRNDLSNVTADLTDTIRRAQWQAMNGRENSEWGVHVEPGSFTVFKGGTYNPSATDNISTTVPNSISISGIAVAGGGDDILFSSALGSTTTAATMTVEIINSGETETILVKPVGAVIRQ